MDDLSEEQQRLREHWISAYRNAAPALAAGQKPYGHVAGARRRTARAIGDLFLGRRVDTAEYYGDLDHFVADNTLYDASGWLFLPVALRRREVGPDDVFVDFGCGAGRVLYQAARRYRCRRIIGVELTERLAQLARANIARNATRLRTRDVEVVQADATHWDVPPDLTIAYFYYPLGDAAFATVIGRLVESWQENPRRLRIIYAAPASGHLIEQTGVFRLIRSRNAGIGGRLSTLVHVYEAADPRRSVLPR